MSFLAVGLGGMLGAIARYAISRLMSAVSTNAFPWGTLIVNIAGCFALGALASVFEKKTAHATLALFLTTGILGGFTTFSAFGLETIELIRAEKLTWACLNVAGSVGLGLFAVVVGRFIFRSAV